MKIGKYILNVCGRIENVFDFRNNLDLVLKFFLD